MARRTISITATAYQRLAQERGSGEGFSDVILRRAGRRSLRALANVVSSDEAEALADAIDATGRRRAPRRTRRLDKLP